MHPVLIIRSVACEEKVVQETHLDPLTTMNFTTSLRARRLACVISLSATAGAHAATYYVDATTGNDAWSGTSSATTTPGQGPWQSLGKIASTNLLPGDRVLLKCGHTWKSTLRVSSSGTVDAPILIGTYPDGCTDKPMIDGSATFRAHQWVHEAGNVFRTSLTPNLVVNGAFNSNLAGWTRYSPNGDATLTHVAACAPNNLNCLALRSGSGTRYSIATSPLFGLDGGRDYSLSVQYRVPAGTSARLIVRRNAAPYDIVGLFHVVTGNGGWQIAQLTFKATTSLANARFDLEVPGGGITAQIANLNVWQSETATPLKLVAASADTVMNVAHHPNRGFNPLAPESNYLETVSDGDLVTNLAGTLGSSILFAGTDLRLPASASLANGTSVFIRTVPWLLEQRTITASTTTRIHLNNPTRYPLKRGFGYFLTGAAWMLDSPGEWHADPTANHLRVWMPDGKTPGDRISGVALNVGLDLESRAYVTIENIAIRATGIGVFADRSNFVTLRGLTISETSAEGISVKGSLASTIEYNSLSRTDGDAIVASNAIGSLIRHNTISENAVRVVDGTVASIPKFSAGAILSGNGARVEGNLVTHAGYNGIRGGADNHIEGNIVRSACMSLNDCGGIYVSTESPNSVITNNIVESLPGNLHGVPSAILSHAVGIYLDNAVDNVRVMNNVIHDADYGIQIHNAHNGEVTGNLLYGNRSLQLWFQEDSNNIRSSGDIFGNAISGNFFFPSGPTPSVRLESSLSTHDDFGTFSENHYSALFSDQILVIRTPAGFVSHDLLSWQTARIAGLAAAAAGTPSETQLTQSRYAPILTTGVNIVPNSRLTNGVEGWAKWNQTAPLAQFNVENCAGIGNCLRLTAGGSVSLLSSPNFSTEKDKMYRVTFDARVSTNGTAFTPVVRRGGPTSYEKLMPELGLLTGGTSWRRYSFTFKSSKTVVAADPQTGDFGARLDFEKIPANSTFWVANVEIVPLAQTSTRLSTHYLSNPSHVEEVVDCPERGQSDESICGDYLDFTTEAEVQWPVVIEPRKAMIIFSRDSTLVDSDGDGVPNAQDICANSPTSFAVNAAGCALGQ